MIHCWALYRPKLSVHFASGYSAASTDTLSSKIDSFALKTLLCLVVFIFLFNRTPVPVFLIFLETKKRPFATCCMWRRRRGSRLSGQPYLRGASKIQNPARECALRNRRVTIWKKGGRAWNISSKMKT